MAGISDSVFVSTHVYIFSPKEPQDEYTNPGVF